MSFRRGAKRSASLAMLACAPLLGGEPSAAQRTGADPYILGQEKRLQIVVHILGEVRSPGEYLVPDDTDVLELLSKAGGATEFANVGSMRLRRRSLEASATTPQRVIEFNLNEFLENESAKLPPVLQPGDVVSVPRNKKYGWRTAFTMIRDVSVVVSTYLLYRRVVDDK